MCFNSRDLAGIFEPIEALAASLKVIAVSLPYRPLEASERRFVSLVRCAVKGGIAGSGIGIVGGILATGATGAATSVASQIYADDKKLNEVDWNSVVIAGGIDAVTYGVGKYKIKGKGPTVQEQLRKQMTMYIRRNYIRRDMTKNGNMEKVINVQ